MTRICLLFCLLFVAAFAIADDPSSHDATVNLAAGHSTHGEAFNEGPRQAAYLMQGMGSTRFASSASDEATQKFIDQGVAQLHGFWYFEAERSFRQAAMLEPELAIAYWGMAMANVNNSERALGFIAEAEKFLDKASEREKAYIKGFAKYLRAGKSIEDDKKLTDETKKTKRREREEDYIKDLERIIDKSPDDVDAIALTALQVWIASRNSLPVTSHYAVDGLLDRVFSARPDHPAHHYRIHLWDNRRPENALASAAQCGPSQPGIAHMWHMPGHIYSRLHRYGDAAWQQEASARVDHAHMMRDRLMPDQIHNFAHNNEWLIRNLLFLGRVREAVTQSRNLISLPQHPKYNTIGKGGSAKHGRERLIDTYTQFEMWDELVEVCDGPLLPKSDDFDDRIRRQSWLIVALQLTSKAPRAGELLRELRLELLELQRELVEASGTKQASSKEKTEEETPKFDAKSQREKISQLRKAIALGIVASAVRKKDAKLFEKQISLAGKIDGTLHSIWLSTVGEEKKALELIRKTVKESPGQMRPQAVLVELLWKSKDTKAVKAEFNKLQSLAGVADLDTPLLKRLAPIAEELELGADWRQAPKLASDIGERPPLDTLGPKQWTPYEMPDWKALTPTNRNFRSKSLQGRPKIIIFYLGFGCLHCVEQLKAFSPHLDGFKKLGIEFVGISTETVEDLRIGIEGYDKPVGFSLYSDSDQVAFKDFRCVDDFEKSPLHGTFLVDGDGSVRWQDIGYEPFMDIEFLLKESERLLKLPEPGGSGNTLAKKR